MRHKCLKDIASIPTNDCVHQTGVPGIIIPDISNSLADTDIYKSSFFPQTKRDWNSLTDSLISASEYAEDSVTKFTFLIRARD